MKRSVLFVSSLLLGLCYYACQEASLNDTEVPVAEPTETIHALANDQGPSSGEGEVCRFFCQGNCEGGGKCSMAGNWSSGFICGPCSECAMIFVYDETEFYPGDPGYDDLWNHVHDRDPMQAAVEQYMAEELGVEYFILEEGYLFTDPEFEEYAFRYHLKTEGNDLYTVMAINKQGDHPVWIFDCVGQCSQGPLTYDCLEHYTPFAGRGCSFCEDFPCFSYFLPYY
jgi:hypothetical protein